MAEYTLMHRDIPVADVDVLPGGVIRSVGRIRNAEHLPVRADEEGGVLSALTSWWENRRIPIGRPGLDRVLSAYEIEGPGELAMRSLGAGLSDAYWMRPEGSDFEWDDVEFYRHPFRPDLGEALFGRFEEDPVLISPDQATDGMLGKRWTVSSGRRCLIKSGRTPYRQEPFNEIIATMLMDTLEIPHVRYDLILDNGLPCSICPDMVDGRTELVSAANIIEAYGKGLDLSPYDAYVECCRRLGVDVERFLDGMILIDCIMLNGDRHTGNFGLIRDTDTLEWIGPAPIYDTGTSLLCSHRTDRIDTKEEPRCRPFADSFPKEIGMMKEPERFDPGKAADALPRVRSILDMGSEWLGEDRIDRLMAVLEHRIGKAGEFAGWMNRG